MRQIILFRVFQSLFFLNPVWVLYLISKGISVALLAIMDVIFWSSIFLFEIPTGVIADKYGRKLGTIIGLLIVGVAILIFGFSDSVPIFLVSYFFGDLGLLLLVGQQKPYFMIA